MNYIVMKNGSLTMVYLEDSELQYLFNLLFWVPQQEIIFFLQNLFSIVVYKCYWRRFFIMYTSPIGESFVLYRTISSRTITNLQFFFCWIISKSSHQGTKFSKIWIQVYSIIMRLIVSLIEYDTLLGLSQFYEDQRN